MPGVQSRTFRKILTCCVCTYICHDGFGGHRTTGVSALLPSTHESGNGTSQVVTLSKFPYPLSGPASPISFLSLLVVTGVLLLAQELTMKPQL